MDVNQASWRSNRNGCTWNCFSEQMFNRTLWSWKVKNDLHLSDGPKVNMMVRFSCFCFTLSFHSKLDSISILFFCLGGGGGASSLTISFCVNSKSR